MKEHNLTVEPIDRLLRNGAMALFERNAVSDDTSPLLT